MTFNGKTMRSTVWPVYPLKKKQPETGTINHQITWHLREKRSEKPRRPNWPLKERERASKSSS